MVFYSAKLRVTFVPWTGKDQTILTLRAEHWPQTLSAQVGHHLRPCQKTLTLHERKVRFALAQSRKRASTVPHPGLVGKGPQSQPPDIHDIILCYAHAHTGELL